MKHPSGPIQNNRDRAAEGFRMEGSSWPGTASWERGYFLKLVFLWNQLKPYVAGRLLSELRHKLDIVVFSSVWFPGVALMSSVRLKNRSVFHMAKFRTVYSEACALCKKSHPSVLRWPKARSGFGPILQRNQDELLGQPVTMLGNPCA